MITQKDIAKEAGVSIVTVSNVINGKYHKVSEENIKKIQDLIKKYDYTPNATARSLAKKESRIVGVVIPNIGAEDNFLQSPYNAEVLGVLERVIRARDYYMMVRCVGNCREVIPILNTWNVDGVIFLGSYESDASEFRERMGIPMIFLDTYFREAAASAVKADDFKGGYLAAKYLIAMGHEDILLAGPQIHGDSVVPKRYQGYAAAMKEHGLEDKIRWQYVEFTTYDCGVENGKKIAFLDRIPTAVFATADIIALGIMEGLHLSGKRVPEDISIVGFDNLTEGRYSTPKLTTVSQNISLKAEIAAKHLFEMIRSKEERRIDESVDVEMVERQSVKRLEK